MMMRWVGAEGPPKPLTSTNMRSVTCASAVAADAGSGATPRVVAKRAAAADPDFNSTDRRLSAVRETSEDSDGILLRLVAALLKLLEVERLGVQAILH